MSSIVNYECNGCGAWGSFVKNDRRPFSVMRIDLSRYIAFSTGFMPQKSEVEIHFCDSCHSKILDGQMRYSTDGTFNELLNEIERLKKEMQEMKWAHDSYKLSVAKLLEPLNK